MINLLRVQFFRIKRAAYFWIMLALCAALPLLSVGGALPFGFGAFGHGRRARRQRYVAA